MILVSDTFKTAINAPSRYITPLVKVYFDGENQPPVEFAEDKVISISLLEESQADTDSPLGAVSSNELSLVFDNSDRVFTPNPESPYFGKVRPNIMIRAYLQVEIKPERFETVPLGVFWTGDWEAPSSSVEATVTCHDRLYAIGERDAPDLPMVAHTTIYDMLVLLFGRLGLEPGDYDVDTSLTQPIELGWIPKSTVRSALQVLATAGNCNITADRYGRIRVRSNFAGGSPVAIMTDNDQIVTAENPSKYLDCYNAVKVNYKIPRLKPVESVIQIESLSVPNGGMTMLGVDFSSGPVAKVQQVQLNGAVNASVKYVSYGPWSIFITINNPGPDEVVSLDVLGQIVDLANSAVTAEDAEDIAAYGRKTLSVDNYLIQSLQVAQEYAISLLQYVQDPATKFSLSIRGDPSLEVGDIIQLIDSTDRIGTVNVVPLRIQIDYDGALSAAMEARKPIIPVDWVFVSRTLVERVPREIPKPIMDWVFVGRCMVIQTQRR